MKVDHWYDDRGRWCARHVCGDPPSVSEWLCPKIVSDAPVRVELRCGTCGDRFVTAIEVAVSELAPELDRRNQQ